MSDEEHRRLKLKTAREGKSIQEVVMHYINQYIDDELIDLGNNWYASEKVCEEFEKLHAKWEREKAEKSSGDKKK